MYEKTASFKGMKLENLKVRSAGFGACSCMDSPLFAMDSNCSLPLKNIVALSQGWCGSIVFHALVAGGSPIVHVILYAVIFTSSHKYCDKIKEG